MSRRADTPQSESGRAVWKALEKIEYRGHSRDRIFRDWLDITLSGYLALTENVQSGRMDVLNPETWVSPDNEYEREYQKIIERYKDDQPKGNRAIDFFAEAYSHALLGIYKDDADPFGDVYMAAITFGEHGQYFTPRHLADMMAQITIGEIKDGQTVVDPSGCGSGIMLLAAAKINPRARFMGIDLDERCAKMTALNLCLRELSGTVYCGNGLTGEMYTRYDIKRGWITRNDKPEPLKLPKSDKPQADGRGQLILL